MKLKLEVYREITILQIQESVSLSDISMLMVGFGRLSRLEHRWIILDLSHAILDEEVLLQMLEIRPELQAKVKDFIWVGPSPELCNFKGVVEALYSCQKNGATEARFIIEKFELEEQVKNLMQQKELANQESLLNLSESQRKEEISKLRRETFRLKKLQTFLINDMVRQAYHAKKSELIAESSLEAKEKSLQLFKKLKLLTGENQS
jgi:hypothetical protein